MKITKIGSIGYRIVYIEANFWERFWINRKNSKTKNTQLMKICNSAIASKIGNFSTVPKTLKNYYYRTFSQK